MPFTPALSTIPAPENPVESPVSIQSDAVVAVIIDRIVFISSFLEGAEENCCGCGKGYVCNDCNPDPTADEPTGTYESTACSVSGSNTCSSCAAVCSGNTFETVACSSKLDRVCEECDAVCSTIITEKR